MCTNIPEESRPDFMKNWRNEKTHFEILVAEIYMKWKNWRELRKLHWEKVMLQCRSSFHRYRNCKKGGFFWMMQENLKKMNRSAVENYLTFPVSRQSFQVLDLCWAATKASDLITWNSSVTRGNVFWQSTSSNRYITDTSSSRNSLLYESKCYRWNICGEEYSGTYRDWWRTKLETLYQCRVLQENRQPWILSFHRKYHRILWFISKDCKSRSFNLQTFNVFMLEDSDSKPSWVLAPIFPRRPCYGSKWWRWSISVDEF